MRQIILDTSAYSHFKRGQTEIVSLIRSIPKILIPTIVLGELLGGFEFGNRRQKNHEELNAFLKSPRVAIVDITPETAERYAIIYAYLRKNGTPIPTNDLWIAASSMEHSATVVTADSHFSKVPQIVVTQL